MNATWDPSVLRRRRTVEGSALVSRGAGLLCTLLFMAGWIGMPAGIEDVPPIRLACLAGAGLMVFALILAVVNLRWPAGRHYGFVSIAQVIADTVAIAGIVVAIQAHSELTTWPLISMPILTAALRARLTGALLAWVATSGILVFAVALFGGRAMQRGDLVVAVCGNLLIAILSGTQASAHGRQVTELDRARRRLAHQAGHDGLTGLANRKSLEAHAAALDGRAMAVLLLDLDGFKAVNDTLGHAAGDELLRAVGERLRDTLRAGDLAGRIGGDEFVVVLAGADEPTARGLADRLRAEVRRPVDIGGTPVTVGVSVGVATRAEGGDAGFDALCRAADTAMYAAKATRNRSAPVSPR